ncbi:hypothetical protein [Paenibacillus mesotrionivorans]|uniref:Uncharacterized protein n=1 Tax=Paenibacillus mesotrionivorans TaxID=3160968 RepID=A0ACC7NVJ4_9BACL
MRYDLVIIGATAAALGLAKTVQSGLSTLIVNQTEMVAYEFVNTFREPEVYARGAFYHKAFKELEADVLLGTEVAGMTRSAEGGYVLELYNTAGFQTVETSRLVDTTAEAPEVRLQGKSLNALLIQQQGKSVPDMEWEAFSLVPEAQSHAYSTAILKMACPEGETVATARHRLVEAWLSRPEALGEWEIAAIAFVFEQIPVQGKFMAEDGRRFLVSAAYAGPAQSEEAGIQLGRSLLAC